MFLRRTFLVLAMALGFVVLTWGCSQATRYRVLCFFFDGVPKPGPALATEAPGAAALPTVERPARPPRKQEIFAHPPYKENRCKRCHDLTFAGMRLFKRPEEGLCVSCHTDPPGQARYLHGPVAVNACLQCHHFHASRHPKMLLDDVADICFRCHRRVDLSGKPHHATIEQHVCIDCHDPHGGDNRFFLIDPGTTEPRASARGPREMK